jgi:hypothetical protein
LFRPARPGLQRLATLFGLVPFLITWESFAR